MSPIPSYSDERVCKLWLRVLSVCLAFDLVVGLVILVLILILVVGFVILVLVPGSGVFLILEICDHLVFFGRGGGGGEGIGM